MSHCILAQCVMADGVVKDFPGPVKPVVEFCLKHDVNIMQMPCPETLCAAGGLGREPHGKSWYEARGLRETAKGIANGQADYLASLVKNGFEVLGVIGVEFSPACAVTYLNKGRSVQRGRGVFIEELQQALNERGLKIPFVGVRQRWRNKMLKDLERLIAPVPA